MRSIHRLAILSAAAASLLLAAAGTASAGCIRKAGEGWSWNEEGARFQSFEIIQQITGNWPFQTDDIKIKSQKCKPDGNGVTCITVADVCSAG